MSRIRVAVLMGGPSPEREVSIASGRQIVAALDRSRYEVLPVEITRDGRWLPRPEMAALPTQGEGPASTVAGEVPPGSVASAAAGEAPASTATGEAPPGPVAFPAGGVPVSPIPPGAGMATGEVPTAPVASVAAGQAPTNAVPLVAEVSVGAVPPGPIPSTAGSPAGAMAHERFTAGERIDVAFIAMHGPGGEDGAMQGLLELLGIPYTGSGILASALAMDKLRSRQIFEWHRIPVPGYVTVTPDCWQARDGVHREVAEHLGYPCVVKPNAVGSSIGVSLVREAAALEAAIEAAFAFGPVVLVEEYIAGTELTCGILDDPQTGRPAALPLIEIVPHAEFYDYGAKYVGGGSDHLIPARVDAAVAARAQALALAAYQALGCAGMGRVDMIARGTDVVVLELNTIPGMTATSLLPDAARAGGLAFPDLVDRIVHSALRRAGRPLAAPRA